MSDKLPVVAAIPNYNMGNSLDQLLPQILEQAYDEVYVLDDASTDHSRDVAAAYGADVRFVGGEYNAGAGANRNRIIGALGHEALIHFIDADMRLHSERNPERIRDALHDETVAFAGGLVLDTDDRQHFVNYGPRIGARTNLSGIYQYRFHALAARSPEKAAAFRQKHIRLLESWPDTLATPRSRQTFWVLESNLFIHSATFERLGGFNPRLRFHEIQDLAIRCERAGLSRRFEPSVAAKHTDVQVRRSRYAEMMAAETRIIRKHGLYEWLVSADRFSAKTTT